VYKNNHCYDSMTEILTQSGWKPFDNLEKGECVLTPDGFQIPQEILKYDYKGKMLEYEGKSLNFCVTPEHNMWVADQVSTIRNKKPEFKRREARDLHQVMWASQHVEWEGRGLPWSDDDICWFGFWLAEGCKSKNNQGSKYAHVDQNYDEEVEELMRRLGANIQLTDKPIRRYTLGVKYYNLVKDQGVCHEKFIPRFMLDGMNRRQLELLTRWMIKGDGTHNKRMWRYNTTSKRLADDMQEAQFKIGRIASISVQKERLATLPSGKVVTGREVFHVNIREQCLAQIRKNKLRVKDYKGKIYCVNTDAGVVFVRRNGKAFWCGQSWDAFKYFFNSYFVKPELAPEENDTPLLGYAGLLEDFKGLRKKKIEVLKPKKDARGILRLHTNNRRVFR